MHTNHKNSINHNEDFIEDGRSSAFDLLLDGLRRLSVSDVEPNLAATSTTSLPFLPTEGVPPAAVCDEMERLARRAIHPARPGWTGHMDPPPLWASVLGASAAALLNNNMLMPEMSPSFTDLEERLIRGFADELGLGAGSGGTLTGGGTLANLLALTVARNDRIRRSVAGGAGRWETLASLSVVASADAHTSVHKAAMLLGLDPEEGVLSVPPGPDGRLRAADMAAAIDGAAYGGRDPFCVVATAGTTVLGALDPLADLADLAREQGAWYHVDAAYGGALALSPVRRHMLQGIGSADSVTLNPQKWLYVAKVCAMALFADAERWQRAMGGSMPYAMPSQKARTSPAARVEGTRQADALKLRLALVQMGRAGYEALIEQSFTLARQVEAEVQRRPFLELAAPVHTNIVVFRCRTPTGDRADDATADLQGRLHKELDVFLSLPEYAGRRWLRAVMLNPFTDEATLDDLFRTVDAFADERGLR